jgi:hypothetical protein
MHTYTYFWVNEAEHTVSPYFDSEKEAYDWNAERENWDNFKLNKDLS